MRNILLLSLAVFCYSSIQAQDCTGADHTVLAGNYYYNPSTLTVTAGESIAFLNEGGFHNVNGVTDTQTGTSFGNPEDFSLGANSGSVGGVCMGTVTLNTPGTYTYDCSIGSHAALGMVGTIIVEAAGPSTVDVTFNVNMANETTSPDGVFLAGGADFGVAGDNPMSDTDGDDIWTITMPVAVGYTGNYTFLNGNCGDWSCKENINGQPCADGPYSDRLLSNITENTTISTCFSQCTTDGSCETPSYEPIVTFQVDMSNAGLTGGETIYVTGSFDGWCGPCTAMDDSDGDNVYTVDMALAPSQGYEFKYMINAWGGDEQNIGGTACDFVPGDAFGNRGFNLGVADTVLAVQCFDFCGTCDEQNTAGVGGCLDSGANNYNGAADYDDGSCQYNVTFQVDMSDYTGSYGTVNLNGSFNGWCGPCAPMASAGGNIYTLTASVPADTLEYKFTLDGWTAQEEFAGGESCTSTIDGFTNRSIIVTADATLDVVCYNSCDTCESGGGNPVDPTTVSVTLNVNMANQATSPEGVFLAGGADFGAPGTNPMSDTDGDDIWTITLDLDSGYTGFYTFANGACTDYSCKENLSGLPCGDPANFNDRQLVNIVSDTTISTCFAECSTDGSCSAPPTEPLLATLDVSCSGVADVTSVRLTGPWWGWDPAGGPEATVNGTSGLWEVTFDPAPSETMEYLWVVNSVQENLIQDMVDGADCAPVTDYANYANRQWMVTDGNIADTYDTCTPCGAGPDSVMVTITVDMSEEEVNPIGVFVAGSFQGWSPGSTLATDNGDGTWSYSFNAAPGTNVQYKWMNGTAWGFEETVPGDCQYPGDTNRGFDVPTSDYSHPVHCYASCNPCGAATYAATLTVLADNITVAGDGMYAAGAFEGWSGTAMSDNGDGSWSITLDLEAGAYEFKFQNGAGGWEELDCGGNRSLTVDGSGPVSYTGCFAQCGEATECAVDPDPANVTFQVDMSEVTDLIADSVYMIGSFTDPVWQAGAILMDDSDGDLVYTATALISGPAGISYKFFNGNPYPNGAGTEEGGETADFAAGGCGVDNGVGGFNRTHDRSGSDETLDVVCFNSCSACGGGVVGAEVTFSVDMNNYGGTFGFVNVSGSWNEFCGDCNQLTDDDLDGIWSGTLIVPEGENQSYKYQVDGWADQEDLAPGGDQVGPCVRTAGGFTNRDLDVSSLDAIDLGVVCWASCLECAAGDAVLGCTDDAASNYDAAATANNGSCLYDVTFSVNMAEYPLADLDSVYVNGTFNGWCGPCNALLDEDGDGVYSATIELAYDYYEYKYTVNGWTAEENLAGIGACVTENFGFTNRVLQVAGDQSEPVVCWNSCSDCEGGGQIFGCTDASATNYSDIATDDNGSCTYPVTFQVDMDGYSGTYGMVNLNGSFAGWCGACITMTDDDSDNVYEVTVDLAIGTVEYKFTVDGWSDQENFDPSAVCTSTIDGFTNRTFDVAGASTLDVVCWNSCYACDAATGCTDADAQNYDADAVADDGSCAYVVTIRLDMSTQAVSAEGVHVAGAFQGWDPGSTPMTTPGLGLYEYTVQLANGSYQYIFINGNVWDGQETVPADCGADNGQGGFNRLVTVAGSDMTLDVVCFNSCEACAGCTDPLSAEFSPFAGSDDGSCATPLVFGCTYADADNYNPASSSDDGSCIFTGASDCPTDIDGDGATAVGDLLIVLGAFGQACE